MPVKPKKKPEQYVLGYLLHWGSINRHRALTHCTCWSLPTAIFNLRRKGYNITRTGSGDNLTYTLVKPQSNG
jgi:hypothetical protein